MAHETKAVLLDLDDTLIRFPSSHAKAMLLWHAAHHLGRLFSDKRPHFAAPFALRALAEARKHLLRERAFVAHGREAGIETSVATHWTYCLQEALERLGRVEAHERDLGRISQDFFQGAFARVALRTTRGFLSMASLVRELRERGTLVVLATNPLVPRTSVEKRLSCAGLTLEDFDFATYAENSRFLKPSAFYYADILAQLEMPARFVAMVGNDSVRDGAARQVGVRTLIVAPVKNETRAVEETRHFIGLGPA